MTPYLQTLDRDAFGNYRQLLYDITLNPAMGNYLDVNNNTKTRPNENYAREILQLFSIGTVRLNLDGTQQLDGAGQPIPTYDQTTVNNFARVFTGWRFAPGATGVPNYIDPMVVNEAQHDIGIEDAAERRGAAGRAGDGEGPRGCDRQHLQRSERRPVHLEAADSAPRHEQSEPGLRGAGRVGVQRRRRHARRSARGRQGHPSRSRGARRREDRRELRPLTPSGAVHSQRAARVQCALGGWHRRQRRVSQSAERQHGDGRVQAAVGLQLLLAWHASCRAPTASADRSSGCSRRRRRSAARTSSTRWRSRALRVSTNAPSGTSLDLSGAAGARRQSRAAGRRAQRAADARDDVGGDAPEHRRSRLCRRRRPIR